MMLLRLLIFHISVVVRLNTFLDFVLGIKIQFKICIKLVFLTRVLLWRIIIKSSAIKTSGTRIDGRKGN